MSAHSPSVTTAEPADADHQALQTAIDRLQTAALLTGALRNALTTHLDDLGKLHHALEQARAALRAIAHRDSTTNGTEA